MDVSDFIAAIALVISFLSAWVSYRAYRYSVRVKEQESNLAFSREKSEFLVRIDKARKSFHRLEHRLNGLLYRINRGADDARQALAVDAEMLNSDLSYLEGCQRQAWSLWEEAYEMSQSGLAHHKPRFLGLIEDDEQFASEAQMRCDRWKSQSIRRTQSSQCSLCSRLTIHSSQTRFAGRLNSGVRRMKLAFLLLAAMISSCASSYRVDPSTVGITITPPSQPCGSDVQDIPVVIDVKNGSRGILKIGVWGKKGSPYDVSPTIHSSRSRFATPTTWQVKLVILSATLRSPA